MKFGNVALLCKGWYKTRAGRRPDLFWMDMAHAIDADGWTVMTRGDVARWCLHRLDDMKKDEKIGYNYQNLLSLSYIFDEIENQIRRSSWYSNCKISREDAIIWTFRDIVSNMEKIYFEGDPVLPNSNVLPFSLNEAWYEDGRYTSDHLPRYHFGDMTCDYLKRVHDMFPNGKEQEIEDGRFDWVESFIHNDSWKDIVVLPGEDNLNDCEEYEISAKELKNATIDSIESIDYFELGKFSSCKDIEECKDPDKRYIVRLYVERDNYWNEYRYTLKSIKEV